LSGSFGFTAGFTGTLGLSIPTEVGDNIVDPLLKIADFSATVDFVGASLYLSRRLGSSGGFSAAFLSVTCDGTDLGERAGGLGFAVGLLRYEESADFSVVYFEGDLSKGFAGAMGGCGLSVPFLRAVSSQDDLVGLHLFCS
jgi:hypothetical protein